MSESLIGRLQNAHNFNQRYDLYKRVLCICSGGLLRSPTHAYALSQDPFNFNTRSAGIDTYHCLTAVDDVLVEWADEFVVMDVGQKRQLLDRYGDAIVSSHRPKGSALIVVMNIPDRFQYRDPQLIDLIKSRYPVALREAEKLRSDPKPTSDVMPEIKSAAEQLNKGKGPNSGREVDTDF